MIYQANFYYKYFINLIIIKFKNILLFKLYKNINIKFKC